MNWIQSLGLSSECTSEKQGKNIYCNAIYFSREKHLFVLQKKNRDSFDFIRCKKHTTQLKMSVIQKQHVCNFY